MRSMPNQLTAEDIVPLVAALTPQERARFIRLVLEQKLDSSAYRVDSPTRDEFSTDEEPLAWDAEGWEEIG